MLHIEFRNPCSPMSVLQGNAGMDLLGSIYVLHKKGGNAVCVCMCVHASAPCFCA